MSFGGRTLNSSKLFWQGAFIVCFVLLTALPHSSTAQDWSATKPAINLSHIFEGAINARGKPVGFHARPHGRDPEGAKLDRLIAKPNQLQIYTGSVLIWDGSQKQWKAKSLSSFYPDQLSRDEIQAAILKAYGQAKVDKRGQWRGPSGLGFTIEGWLCPKGGRPTCPDGAINTAYPIYKKDD